MSFRGRQTTVSTLFHPLLSLFHLRAKNFKTTYSTDEVVLNFAKMMLVFAVKFLILNIKIRTLFKS